MKRQPRLGHQPLPQLGKWAPVEALRNQLGRTEVKQDTRTNEDGWLALLESGRRWKAMALHSPDFSSVAQASQLLGITESAIRKRIREGKLFALGSPLDGDCRIPLWALDATVAGSTTTSLYDAAQSLDPMRLYHFLVMPCGVLHGLRPFECLVSTEQLPPAQSVARAELAEHYQRAASVSMVDLVLQALHDEMEDGPR